MRVRHTSDGPETARNLGVSTEAGDEVDVDRSIGRRLLERRYYELPEDVCNEQTDAGHICGRDQPCHYHDAEDE